MLNFVAVAPHSPIIIPEIGGSQTKIARKTVSAMETLSEELRKSKPDVIVIISPHGPMRYDKFTINLEENLKGSFESFGSLGQERFNFLGSLTLSRELFRSLRNQNFPVEIIRENVLDHGVLVPLNYLAKHLAKKPHLIPLTFTALDWPIHFKFGKVIGEILEKSQQNVAFIASADLSHRLSSDAPAGFSPYGTKFDHTLIDLIKQNEVEKILNLNPEFCEEAGQCGLNSIVVALGVLSNFRYSFKQLSYEGPFGVGYLVGQWKIS